MVPENITGADVLVNASGEVKISNIENCKRDGDKSCFSASFSKLVMSLMEKTKPLNRGPGLSRVDRWKPDAIDFFTATTSEFEVSELMSHVFLSQREASDLKYLVYFVLISACHDRE